VNLQTAQAIVGNPTPTGAIMMWPMPTAPTGYLVCDGSAQSRSIYASLFAVIGTTYGVGDGSSTFNLPNLKGQVPVGLDASQTEFNAVAKSGGAKTVTLTESELAAHNHTQNAHNHLQNAHTHIQDAHTHVQDSHNHTQNSHNHTQNSHNHTQDAHTHNPYSRDMYAAFDSPIVNEAVGAIAGTGFTMAQTAGSITGHTVMASTTPTNQATTPTNIAATATNIAATATNQTTAATSQSTTPTNQSTVATNEPAGGGLPHNNLQPFIVLNYIIKG
jgi:microcystin-dependent protein